MRDSAAVSIEMRHSRSLVGAGIEVRAGNSEFNIPEAARQAPVTDRLRKPQISRRLTSGRFAKATGPLRSLLRDGTRPRQMRAAQHQERSLRINSFAQANEVCDMRRIVRANRFATGNLPDAFELPPSLQGAEPSDFVLSSWSPRQGTPLEF